MLHIDTKIKEGRILNLFVMWKLL